MSSVADASRPLEAVMPRMGRWKKFGLVVLLLAIAFVVYASSRPLSVLRAAGRLTLLSGGIHSHYAQVGPYRVHYYEGGEGPPLVFVHGLGAESLNWVPAMLSFRHQFHVYAIDLLGLATEAPSRIDYADLRCRQFLWTGRRARHVVGVSAGGWVTLKFCSIIQRRQPPRRCKYANFGSRSHRQVFFQRRGSIVITAILTPRMRTRPSLRRDFCVSCCRASLDHAPHLRLIPHLSRRARRQTSSDKVSGADHLGEGRESDPNVGRRGDEATNSERFATGVYRFGAPCRVRMLEQVEA